MSARKFLAAAAASVALAGSGAYVGTVAATAGSDSPYITDAVAGSDVKVSGCVIRFSNADGTPSIHANGAHRCAGVESVRIDGAGQIEVIQTVSGPSENPILFAMCQTDETLGGKRGITCGATGGTGDTSFRLYDTQLGRPLDLRYPADRDRVQGPVSNLWVGWFHTSWGWDR